MATQTKDDIAISGSWADLVAADATLASVDVVVQNIDTSEVRIVWGGTSPGAAKSGHILGYGESFEGNAAAIWVKGGSSGLVSVSIK